MQHYYLCAKLEAKDVLPTASTQGLPAAAGKRQGSDARRRSYC